MKPLSALEFNPMGQYFLSDSVKVYFIGRFTNFQNETYYFSKILENVSPGISSLKLIYMFTPVDAKEKPLPITNGVKHIFESRNGR